MNHSEIRKRYIDFFKNKGHVIVPSSSLVPENDPTTLFTGSGMQPMLPYLLGEKHPLGNMIVDSQKSFRAEDIDEVGDNRHTTFFEMLGNWSFGEYWKEEQLKWMFQFLTEPAPLGIGLPAERLYVTVFSGGDGFDKDSESIEIWEKLFKEKGITAKYAVLGSLDDASKRGMKDGERIFGYSAEKNWWSRAGKPENMPVGEPGGPDSEMFYQFDVEHDPKFGEHCHPNCDCGRYLEIGNNVFMEFRKLANGDFERLSQKNVDFGGGLERMAAASENQPDVFQTSAFNAILQAMPSANTDIKRRRIVADHAKAAFFLISDGVLPSNKERGYVLRRLIRRLILHSHLGTYGSFKGNETLSLGILEDTRRVFKVIEEMYIDQYPNLNHELVFSVFKEEYDQFNKTFKHGIREIQKLNEIDNEIAFKLFESFGVTYEMIKDLAGDKARQVTREGFDEEFRKHQEKSRAGSSGKFGGHGIAVKSGELTAADEEELKKKTRLHTATHLLQAALRKVLGNEVKQSGSDITSDRLRFDFTFSRKMSPEEVTAVQELVNDAIRSEIDVTKEEMDYNKAIESGALAFFKQKYPDRVNVYSVGDISKELCGGPHVGNTKEIGRFKIQKEESVSAGIRRIRAVVE